jgi:hypothetical protein
MSTSMPDQMMTASQVGMVTVLGMRRVRSPAHSAP